MLLAYWAVTGGAGVTVTTLLTADRLRRRGSTPVLVVDLAGDIPTAAGLRPDGVDPRGVADWTRRGPDVRPDTLERLIRPLDTGVDLLPRGRGPIDRARLPLLAQILRGRHSPVVCDVGRLPDSTGDPTADLVRAADRSVLVSRCCYLALHNALSHRDILDGVVAVTEQTRVLTPADLHRVLGAPVLAELPVDPAIARGVDAGLLLRRPPRSGDVLDAVLPDAPVPEGVPA